MNSPTGRVLSVVAFVLVTGASVRPFLDAHPSAWAPTFQTAGLAIGAIGTFVVALIPLEITVRVRADLYSDPFRTQWVDAHVRIAQPLWWRVGLQLLGLSFLAQIAWVWMQWLGFS